MEETYYVDGITGVEGKVFLREWKLSDKNPKKGSAVIIHGLGEHSGRYSEVAGFLNNLGFEVYCEDLPGFGNSSGKRGDVKNISNYISCIKALHKRVLSEGTNAQKMILYGHSMGGLLALWYLETYPRDFDAAIISAPALRPSKKVPGYLLILSKIVRLLFPSFPFKNRINSDQLTDDEATAEQYREDELTHPIITPRLFWQLEDVSSKVWENRDKLPVDLKILFIHGEDDTLVDNEDTKEFFEGINVKDKVLLLLEGVRHEPHKTSNRTHVFNMIKEWLSQRV